MISNRKVSYQQMWRSVNAPRHVGLIKANRRANDIGAIWCAALAPLTRPTRLLARPTRPQSDICRGLVADGHKIRSDLMLKPKTMGMRMRMRMRLVLSASSDDVSGRSFGSVNPPSCLCKCKQGLDPSAAQNRQDLRHPVPHGCKKRRISQLKLRTFDAGVERHRRQMLEPSFFGPRAE